MFENFFSEDQETKHLSFKENFTNRNILREFFFFKDQQAKNFRFFIEYFSRDFRPNKSLFDIIFFKDQEIKRPIKSVKIY